MKPAPFDYVRPPSLEEAVRVLADGEDVLALAANHLPPLLALRMASVRMLVDIGRLDALRQVEDTGDNLVIGAAVTHAEIEDGRVPDPGRGLMKRVAARIAYRAIRNQKVPSAGASPWPTRLPISRLA